MSLKRIFVDYIPVLSLLLYVFFDSFSGNGTLPLMLATTLSLPSFFYYMYKSKQPHQVSLFFLLCFIGCLLLLFVGPLNRRDIFVFIGALSAAIYGVYHLKILKVISFIAIVYTLCFLVEKIFIEQVDVSFLYEKSGQSKNYPGFLLVIWITLYSFLKKIIDNKTSITFPVLAIIIALFLDGRSSLGVLLVLFILNLYFYNKKYSMIFLLIIFGVIFYFFDYIMDLYLASSFSDKGLESSRFAIWSAYLDNIDIMNVLIGVNTSKVPIIAAYSGNPHNSFIFYHMSAGLFGVIGFLYLCFKSIKLYFIKKKYLLLLYVLLVVGRISFDSCLFWPTDFIIYFLMIYIFYPPRVTDQQIGIIKIPFFLKPIKKFIDLF